MPKRITYLEKHAELSLDQFFAHWSTTHALIAKDLPGVIRYLQNHVVRHLAGAEAGEPYRVDGIVELWFDSAEVVDASRDSEVSDRLIDDEKTFMAGLTGGPVEGNDPHSAWPFKVWLLGVKGTSSDSRTQPELLEAAVGEVSAAIGHELNMLEENPDLLHREALRHEPQIPEVAMALGFDNEEQAEAGAEALIAAAGQLTGRVENIHVYVAAEVQVI